AGTLRLDQSQSYSGTVTGFSLVSNTTNFDLSDINYALSTTTAVFVGDSTHGTLTVKDAGNHTAHIALQGADYTGAVWQTTTDNHGGTSVRGVTLFSVSISGNAVEGSTLTAMSTQPGGQTMPVVYQWQRSADGTTWSDIAGA